MKSTIAIIEDDQTLNGAYKTILTKAGYPVVTATNGEEALETLSSLEKEPGLIFLDIRMPKLDGIGFLKAYDKAAHAGTTIIVFTNSDSQKEIDDAYKHGADRYILKARATPNELLRIAAAVLK